MASNLADERKRLARILWDLGFGRELRIASFDAYLASTPSVIPEHRNPKRTDRLVLADRRLGVVKTCKLLSIGTQIKADAEIKDERSYPPVEFIWCSLGALHETLPIRRDMLLVDECSLTAIEGLCLYAEDQHIFVDPKRQYLDLPASWAEGHRDFVPFLERHENKSVHLMLSRAQYSHHLCSSGFRQA